MGGFLLLFFGGLGSVPLLDPDEGRYAEIPREMLQRHDFVTPHLDGVLYFEKPPLYYWLNAAASAALPSPEIASRLAGACFGLAGLGLAWLLGSAMGGKRTGLLAAIVLGTAPLYVALARAAIIDMTVTFFLSAALTCFWLAQEREDDGLRTRLLWYGVFAAAALATLAKGLIGIVIPGAVAFLFLLFTRRWSVLRRVPWVGGPLLFLAIAAPWHVLAARRNPDFLWFYFVHEHVLRYATAEAERQQPFWFFGAILLVGLLPWSGLFPAAAALLRRAPERLRDRRDRPALVFLLSWAGFVVLFFSASRSKLVPYVLPALPPLAVLAALAVAEAEEREGRARRWLRLGAVAGALLLGILAVPFLWASLGLVELFSPRFSPFLFAFALPAVAMALVAAAVWWRLGATEEGRAWGLAAMAGGAVLLIGCLWAVGPRVALDRSSQGLASFLKNHLGPQDEVYAYDCYPQSLPVYLGRLIGVVRYRGELAFGIDHLPPETRARRFPTAGQFQERWRSSRPVYLVLEGRDLRKLEADGLAPGPILWRQKKLLLMTNQRSTGERTENESETNDDPHLSRLLPGDGGQRLRRRVPGQIDSHPSPYPLGRAGSPRQTGPDRP
ncbi:MAG TPA: phospholipid carrier-dependent glycosyltransferase [Thermoanaerobaculia bacterium]|nr:phospholipid carrier-dependent glycosyltransferase [Thermoanaerobaculia bacterium]